MVPESLRRMVNISTVPGIVAIAGVLGELGLLVLPYNCKT